MVWVEDSELPWHQGFLYNFLPTIPCTIFYTIPCTFQTINSYVSNKPILGREVSNDSTIGFKAIVGYGVRTMPGNPMSSQQGIATKQSQISKKNPRQIFAK